MTEVQTNFKRKPWRSEKYRRFVASLPCGVCNSKNVQAHHEQRIGEGVMGGKVSDERCIPLCCKHHANRHTFSRVFWSVCLIDPEQIIAQTQAEWVKRGGEREWEEV